MLTIFFTETKNADENFTEIKNANATF